MEKALKCFERLWNPFTTYWKLKEKGRVNIVLRQLFRKKSMHLDVDGYVLIQGELTNVKIQFFLYDTQQSTKKLECVLITIFERTKNWSQLTDEQLSRTDSPLA